MRVLTKIAARRTLDRGSSLVEYALVISFIVLSTLAALRMIGVRVDLDIRQLVDTLW